MERKEESLVADELNEYRGVGWGKFIERIKNKEWNPGPIHAHGKIPFGRNREEFVFGFLSL